MALRLRQHILNRLVGVSDNQLFLVVLEELSLFQRLVQGPALGQDLRRLLRVPCHIFARIIDQRNKARPGAGDALTMMLPRRPCFGLAALEGIGQSE